MAYYIKTTQESGKQLVAWRQDKAVVDNQYPNTPAEYKQITVADYPEPEDNGKLPHAYYDANTNTVYYEYTELPKSEATLQEQIDDLTLALADLMGGAL